MSIRIYLAGRIALEVDGEVTLNERRFRGKQGRLVFAYLVSEKTRPVSREELAVLLWPEEMPPTWDVALSALMSRLHRLLSSDGMKASGVSLSRGFGQYKLLLPSDTWIDLEAVTSALDAAESVLRNGHPQRLLGPAHVAATIARRPFLAGIEGNWVEAQRQRLERQLLRALECLGRMGLSVGEPDLAVEVASETVGIDPFRESCYQLLMQAYAAGGNRPKAVEVYHRLEKLLSRELGTGPSAETTALYSELLS